MKNGHRGESVLSPLNGLIPVIVAALMAGCAVYVTGRAFGFTISPYPIYAASFGVAGCARLTRRDALRIPLGIALAVGIIIIAVIGIRPVRSLFADIKSNGALTDKVIEAHGAAAMILALAVAFVLSLMAEAVVDSDSTGALVLMTILSMMLISLSLDQDIPLATIIPGLSASVVAFGLMKEDADVRIRLPLVITAGVIVVLALAFVPNDRVTWTPLESLAERIRLVREDYMDFSAERIPFRINEQGFDHGELVDGRPTVVLGGPAHPTDEPVMEVETDVDVLLRGTIERTYTGIAWTDDTPKSRYLYYDFSHRQARRAALGRGEYVDEAAFDVRDMKVTSLSEGSSTLFVPAQLKSFSMQLSDAVYYNSAGEIFMTKATQPGDSYALTAYLPGSDEALLSAATACANAEDPFFEEARRDYCELPDGIDRKVYLLTKNIAEDKNSNLARALAIRDYLRSNYRYTLDGAYAGAGKDFVSWFLLEEKQGYCSYFASAMTVMCRIAGIPARYIEGYSVRADASGRTVVTGKDAHAWTEVYMNGLGWIALDATASDGDAPQGGGNDRPNPDSALDDSGNAPQLGNNDSEDDDPFEDEPDTGELPDDAEDEEDETEADSDETPDEGENEGENEGEEGSDDDAASPGAGPHLWLILAAVALLIVIIFLVRFIRKRLRLSDPILLTRASTCSSAEAATILYRALLTILLQFGFSPTGGETPQAFALRVTQTMRNDAYTAFVDAYAMYVYAGVQPDRAAVKLGRRAYLAFMRKLNRRERLRYALHRIFSGLGSFEQIP